MNFIPKKVKITLCFVLIFGIFGALWFTIPICPMRPVFNIWVGHEQKLVMASSTHLSSHNIELLTKVLANNDEPYCIVGNKVMITFRLFFDKELLWNYTIKLGMPYPDDNYYHDGEYNLWRRK